VLLSQVAALGHQLEIYGLSLWGRSISLSAKKRFHSRMIRALLHTLFSALFICGLSYASPVNADLPSNYKGSVLNEIQEEFTSLTEATSEVSTEKVRAIGSRLHALRELLGLPNLELLSLALLELSKERLRSGERETAAALNDLAEKLSPRAPRVFRERAGISSRLNGWREAMNDVGSMLRWSGKSADLAVGLAIDIILPALRAITLAIYCVLALGISASFIEVVRRMVGVLPKRMRGFFGPLVITVALLVPALLGVLQAISIYSLVVIVFLSERKRIAVLGGAALIAWAVILPVGNSVSGWYGAEDNHLILQASENGAVGTDFAEVKQAANRVSLPRVARYALAMRHYLLGDTAQVVADLSSDGVLLPSQAELELQAILFYKRGDIKAADQRFSELEQDGLGGARFLLNRGTVKSKLLDSVAARQYFERARSLDVDILETGDLDAALKSADTLKLPNLPFELVLAEILQAIWLQTDWKKPLPNHVFSGYPPIVLGSVGILIVLLSMTWTSSRGRSHLKIYPNYQVIGLAQLHTAHNSGDILGAVGFEFPKIVRLTCIFTAVLLYCGSLVSTPLVIGAVEGILQPVFLLAVLGCIGLFGYLYLLRWWSDD
jgi:hypothetical protein